MKINYSYDLDQVKAQIRNCVVWRNVSGFNLAVGDFGIQINIPTKKWSKNMDELNDFHTIYDRYKIYIISSILWNIKVK